MERIIHFNHNVNELGSGWLFNKGNNDGFLTLLSLVFFFPILKFIINQTLFYFYDKRFNEDETVFDTLFLLRARDYFVLQLSPVSIPI